MPIDAAGFMAVLPRHSHLRSPRRLSIIDQDRRERRVESIFRPRMTEFTPAGREIACTAVRPRPAPSRGEGRRRAQAWRDAGRITLWGLVALFVLTAQLGAFTHAISHVEGAALASADKQTGAGIQKDLSSAEEFCLQCLAFAQVTMAAVGYAPIAPLSASRVAANSFFRGPVRQVSLGVYLARGPPSLV